MLSDRDYMRESEGRPPLSMTVKLIIALVVVFALVQINSVYGQAKLFGFLPLSLDGVRQGYVWQLLTFQFLHAGIFHLLCNGLGLWFCGRFVEHILGPRRFLAFFLGTGVVGGLLHLLLAALFPGGFGLVPVIGASAGVMAVVALFCLIQPNAEFLVMFVLPVRARYLLMAEVGIALFFTVVPSDPGIAHAAHLGGILAAILFFRARWHDEMMPLPWSGLAERVKSLFRRRPVATRKPAAAPWAKPETRRLPAAPAEVTPAEFMAREVDPILEKIAAHGIHSLTVREKEILERARSKMTKR